LAPREDDVARDYYAEATELAGRLWDEGNKEWADRLTEVIETGFTSSEILMGLRYQLGQLLSGGPSLPEGLRAQAKSLYEAIDSAL
jgi:hypothetical protein